MLPHVLDLKALGASVQVIDKHHNGGVRETMQRY